MLNDLARTGDSVKVGLIGAGKFETTFLRPSPDHTGPSAVDRRSCRWYRNGVRVPGKGHMRILALRGTGVTPLIHPQAAVDGYCRASYVRRRIGHQEENGAGYVLRLTEKQFGIGNIKECLIDG